MTRIFLVSVAVAGLLSAQSSLTGETVTIVAKDYKFHPEEITVKPGTTLRWVNQEKRQYHSVYFKALGGEKGDYFFPDETRERTFDTPGTYPYICEPHHETHGMKGVVHVSE